MILNALIFQVSVVFATTVAAACWFGNARSRSPIFNGIFTSLAIQLAAAGVAYAAFYGAPRILMSMAISIVLTLPFLIALRNLSVYGRLLVSAQLQIIALGMVWSALYIARVDASWVTRILMLAGFALVVASLPLSVLSMIPQWEALSRNRWSRPRTRLRRGSSYPKVSLHVPICSEPPAIVIETLAALARMDYPNFEVLVIDNNTKDETLWTPVQLWCSRDRRFRFFHLDSCPGAKAGALNFGLTRTAHDATVIGVIDADYQSRPDFLSALIGYFDDSNLGFVQTPHDYREWEGSLYQRMCYWEYRTFFAINQPSWNERDAAVTVGTMALIRRSALEEAGGWSEWCLTEDSELAPRIHSLGYSSVYVEETFGRGLIPETFSGYAKQRRRWIYGPVQELKAHFSMLVPQLFGKPTSLTASQKLFHLQHDLDALFTGIGLLALPVGVAVAISMLLHGERPHVPGAVLASAIVTATAMQIMSWCIQCRAMRCTFGDVICAGIAKTALMHSMTSSSVRAALGIPLSWQRTNKFKAKTQGLFALETTRVELAIGTGLLVLGGLGIYAEGTGLLSWVSIGLAIQGCSYLTAPFVALLSEWELWRTEATGLLELEPEVESDAA